MYILQNGDADECCRRNGSSALEVMVALTLLTTALSLSLPLIIKNDRLLKSQQRSRLALDELSNRIELLTALPVSELPTVLDQLTPSPFVAERLPEVHLEGALLPEEIGQRLVLKISWVEPEHSARPMSLSAWISPYRSQAENQTTRKPKP